MTQKNEGAAAARNKAFYLSQGDYIQWLDADDLLGREKIARQMAAVIGAADRRTLLSSSWGSFLYRPERAIFAPTQLWQDLSPVEFLLIKLGQKASMQTATWLVSRELTAHAGPWNTSMLSDDDGEYFCRALLQSERVRFVNEARVYHRSVGTGRLSYVGRSNSKLSALWRSMQLHIRYLLSLEDSERSRSACIRYLQNYLIDFYVLRPDIVAEMRQTAEHLAGSLESPRLSWKYSWISPICGWRCAQSAQLLLPGVKWGLLRYWDRLLWRSARSGLIT